MNALVPPEPEQEPEPEEASPARRDLSMSDPQPVPVQTLEYQLPADGAAGPWAAMVRAAGWAAAAMSVAHLASGTCVVAFQWAAMSRSVSFDNFWILGALDGLVHVPALVGGIACARLKPYGGRLLRVGLWAALASKALLILLGAVSVASGSFPWGMTARVALVGQNVFLGARHRHPGRADPLGVAPARRATTVRRAAASTLGAGAELKISWGGGGAAAANPPARQL